MKSNIVSALCASIVVSTALASAQSLSYNAQDLDHDSVIDPGNIGYQSSIAYIDDFALMYNPGSKQLDFSATFSKNSASPDGFWFVVSDGPDPKSNANEYAIFYFDASKVAGTGSAILTSYVYDGVNGPTSWQNPGNLLESSQTGTSLSATASTSGNTTTFAFSADVAKTNDASQWPASYGLGTDWDGAQFGEKVGIWFHSFTLNSETEYDKDGKLTKLDIKKSDYFDVSNQHTVPEPSAMLISLLGASLLLRRKR